MVKEKSFLRRFWKPILLAALVLALVLTSVGLNSSSREAKSLREQVERQNELIAALNDEREAAKDKEINVVVTSDTIEQQLSSIRELATQEYVYTNAAKKESSESWLWGVERPFSGKSILITYDGVVKAGVDLSKAEITVNEQTRTVTVTLPPSEITENNIPQEAITVVEIKNGLFNDVTMENYNEFVAEQKPAMEQKAIDQGLLTRADKEAAALVRSILSVLPGMDGYTLVVEQGA